MNCAASSFNGASGVAEALASIDCASRQATALAFDRLFGAHGALSVALGTVLTLYVALLALSLLTGRTRLRLSLLTPRALTLGLVLTFSTSWVAYQQVVWNLTEGAPDEVAHLLMGGRGSSSEIFARQLDRMFDTVSEAAQESASAGEGVSATGSGQKAAAFGPSEVLWCAALLLLVGTAGVLIVAKITLAALLAIGPVFIVLALFGGTRGLFEGWVKATLLFAVTPLVTVLVGSGALAMMAPMVQALGVSGSAPSMRLAVGLLLSACVYTALLVIGMKATVLIAGSWRLPPDRPGEAHRETPPPVAPPVRPALAAAAPPPRGQRDTGAGERIRQLVAASRSETATRSESHAAPPRTATLVRHAMPVGTGGTGLATAARGDRARHVGKRSPVSMMFSKEMAR